MGTLVAKTQQLKKLFLPWQMVIFKFVEYKIIQYMKEYGIPNNNIVDGLKMAPNYPMKN